MINEKAIEKRVERVPFSGCWIWTGSMWETNGYGRYGQTGAHRLSYETYVGPIPDGMCVLHKCDVPLCVNPYHLFVGTKSDNAYDRDKKKRGINSKKTHCIRGHPFSGENLFKDGIGRGCRICKRETWRRNHKKRGA